MKKQLISLFAACSMLATATTVPPVSADDIVEANGVRPSTPDWFPKTYDEAAELYNAHGKTFVEDGYVCLIKTILPGKQNDYTYAYDGSMKTLGLPAEVKTKYFDSENEEDVVMKLDFEVELFYVADDLDLTVIWSEKNSEGDFEVSKTFHFENSGGETTENDIYGWLPDCEPEYGEFLKKNGRASVQENYIAYCADVNGSTGATLKTEQSGTGKVEEFFRSGCNSFDPIPKAGGSSYSVILYKPVADGKVDMTWTIGRDWVEEPFSSFSASYEIKDDCKTIVPVSKIEPADPSLPANATRITLYDKDTGELIPSEYLKNHKWSFGTDIRIENPAVPGTYSYTGPIVVADSNPYVMKNDIASLYRTADSFRFVDVEEPEVKVYDNGAVDMAFRTKLRLTGNINGDGKFGVSDLVTLQQWILGDEDANIYDWAQGDYDFDDRLTSFDVCLMRQELLERGIPDYVEPDNYVTNPSPMNVVANSLTLYLAPDEGAVAVLEIPYGAIIEEIGYNKDNNDWLFTEYEGYKGWVKLYDESGKRAVYYWAVAAKPVIYLYPEEETDVHVELELTEAELASTYPKYNGGWDVTAYPDGRLVNKADGSRHRYLFWDAVDCRARFDFSQGFCVAGADTESFLKEKLAYMGLTEDEANEFIVYWLPLMERNKYNLVSFQGETYTNFAKLNVTPAPDSELRIFMAYVPLEEAEEVEPQRLKPFERNGFTLVEWGGCKVG